MGVIPIFIIIVSAFNDVLDFITAFFPGVNEVVSIIFGAIIGMLVFLEVLQKKLKEQQGIKGMVLRRIAILGATAIMELPIIGLLPFQTVSSVIMYFMSKSEDDKQAALQARRQQQQRMKRMAAESRYRQDEIEDDPSLASA